MVGGGSVEGGLVPSDIGIEVWIADDPCVRVFIGGIRVRDGVTVAVAVRVDVTVGVRLAVRVDVTEAVNAGGALRVGVAVGLSVAMKVCVGAGLLVGVVPPVLGIMISTSSMTG